MASNKWTAGEQAGRRAEIKLRHTFLQTHINDAH